MNETKKLLYLDELKNELGYIEYSEDEKTITLLKTYVYKEGRGKGIAKILNDQFFSKFENTTKNIIIKCTYSISYYEKNIERLKNMNISISTDAINECNL